jgi:hypothetical protein
MEVALDDLLRGEVLVPGGRAGLGIDVAHPETL